MYTIIFGLMNIQYLENLYWICIMLAFLNHYLATTKKYLNGYHQIYTEIGAIACMLQHGAVRENNVWAYEGRFSIVNLDTNVIAHFL